MLYLCFVLKRSDLLKREPRSCKVEQEDSCKCESDDESKGRVPVMRCFGGSEGGAQGFDREQVKQSNREKEGWL